MNGYATSGPNPCSRDRCDTSTIGVASPGQESSQNPRGARSLDSSTPLFSTLVSTSSHRSFFRPRTLESLLSPLALVTRSILYTSRRGFKRKLFKRADPRDPRCNIKKTGTRYSDLIAPRGAIFHVVAPGARHILYRKSNGSSARERRYTFSPIISRRAAGIHAPARLIQRARARQTANILLHLRKSFRQLAKACLLKMYAILYWL